jgi:TolA-binding protein
MSEINNYSYVITTGLVGVIFVTLGYFLWKTLVTSNWFQKGIDLYEQKDYIGAEAAFRQVIGLNYSNDMVRLLLGDVLLKQDKLDVAEQQFREVIGRAPKKVDAYLRLGNVLIQKQQMKEAIAVLQQAKILLEKQRQNEKAEKVAQLLQNLSRNG